MGASWWARHRRWLGWIAGGVATLLLVGILARDVIALGVVRMVLARVLVPAHQLDQLATSLLPGRIDLRGFLIHQPDGFSGPPLLRVGSITVDSQPLSVLGGTLVIPSIEVDAVAVHLLRRPDGELNLAYLRRASASASAGGDPLHGLGLHLRHLRCRDLALVVEDQLGGESWTVAVHGVEVSLREVQLRLGEDAHIALAQALVQVASAHIDQLPGHGLGTLLSVTQASVLVSAADGLDQAVNVQAATVASVYVSLAGSVDGRDNVRPVLARLSDLVASAKRAFPAPPRPAKPLPALLVQRALVQDGRIDLALAGVASDPLALSLHALHFKAQEVRVYPGATAPTVADGQVEVRCRIDQPGDHPDAETALLARVAPICLATGTLPDLRTRLVLTGFALDSVAAALPVGSRTALGADGLDLHASASHAAGVIAVEAEVIGDAGIRFPLSAGGSLRNPRVDLGPLFGGVFNRVGGGLGSVGVDMATVGAGAVTGTAKAVGKLGSGLVSAGASLGEGLFDTVAGIVTLDSTRIGNGLESTTIGTVSAVAGAGLGAANTAGNDIGASVVARTGDQRLADWRQGIPARHAPAVAAARTALYPAP